tara:strand:+ start:497 stop:673 length:177 start_codon:yes stop_codon:yes gene_type:complete
MIQTKNIINTKISKFGDNYERILFPNNMWYDVEKNSYIMVKFWENGDWFIMNKNSLTV